MNRITPHFIDSLAPNEIFVFGSNLQGFHAGGAARQACKWGAVWGQGEGLQGQTYAIPTMFQHTAEIAPYVERFIAFAKENSHFTFLVTAIGCGIAGFTVAEIAPLFTRVLVEDLCNIHLPQEFVEYLIQ